MLASVNGCADMRPAIMIAEEMAGKVTAGAQRGRDGVPQGGEVLRVAKRQAKAGINQIGRR